MLTEYVYIGIDPSMSGSGLCNSFGDKEVIKSNSKNKDISRLMYISNQIERFVIDSSKNGKYKIIVGIEGFSFHSRGRAISQLFGLGWLIRQKLFVLKCEYYEIPPNLWKKFLFNGSLKKGIGKEHILLQTYKNYDVDITNNNICDAFNIMKFIEALECGFISEYSYMKEGQKKVIREYIKKIKNDK